MDGSDVPSDQVISEMLEMGFEYSNIVEAIKVVGPSIPSAVEHILSGGSGGGVRARTSCQSSTSTTHTSKFHAHNGKALKKKASPSTRQTRQVWQSRILDHFQTNGKVTECKSNDVAVIDPTGVVDEHKEPISEMGVDPSVMAGPNLADSLEDLDVASDWEKRVGSLLQKHFGFSSLKSFQKEALSAWMAHKDCLVLAATGSGFTV